jgi:hypothetical protein
MQLEIEAELKVTFLESLLEVQKALRQRSENPVVFSPPILSYGQEGLIWPNTINLIQGQTGTHKSRLAELFSSIVIGEGEVCCDSLGINLRTEDSKYALCYIDSERNQKEQFPLSIQLMRKHAGYASGLHPEHFYYTSLVNIPRQDRLEAVREFLEHTRGSCSRHLVVVIDQLADCVIDFNDVGQTMELVDLLNYMANECDATFICIIHENPGNTGFSKARGHLGTEAVNKSSTVLQVGFVKKGKVADVIHIKCLKRRLGAPNLSFYARYDEESVGLVSEEGLPINELISSRQLSACFDDLIGCLPRFLQHPMEATKLKKLLAKEFKTSEKTIQTRLSNLESSKTPIDAELGLYRLVSRKAGRLKLYSLAEVDFEEGLAA